MSYSKWSGEYYLFYVLLFFIVMALPPLWPHVTALLAAQTHRILTVALVTHSSRGSSQESRGGSPQLHSSEGYVAFPDAREAARPDPWLPGPLCSGGEWRVEGPAPHQGCHAGWRSGMRISKPPFFFFFLENCKFYLRTPKYLQVLEWEAAFFGG